MPRPCDDAPSVYAGKAPGDAEALRRRFERVRRNALGDAEALRRRFERAEALRRRFERVRRNALGDAEPPIDSIVGERGGNIRLRNPSEDGREHERAPT